MTRCCIISEILQKCLRLFQSLNSGQWTQRKIGDYQRVEHFPFESTSFVLNSHHCAHLTTHQNSCFSLLYHARWINGAVSKLIKNDLYSVLDPMKVQKYRIYITQFLRCCWNAVRNGGEWNGKSSIHFVLCWWSWRGWVCICASILYIAILCLFSRIHIPFKHLSCTFRLQWKCRFYICA